MIYPFCAVVGQESAKQALLLCLINPSAGGVLISGEKGTAKSTLVRGLCEVDDTKRLVELPLNVTQDRLLGSIDMERAVLYGEKRFESGILARADGNLLYVDEVNLLSDHIVKCLLDCAASGNHVMEREGIFRAHPARFTLIGSMNPEEGMPGAQFLDRFGLFVSVHGERDAQRRAEIIRRRLLFERDPAAFAKRFDQQTDKLRKDIAAARAVLPHMPVQEPTFELAAELAHQAHCAGNRAELLLVEAARALAAWERARAAGPEHIRRVAAYVLTHRLRDPAVGTEPAPAAESVRNGYEAPRQGGPASAAGATSVRQDCVDGSAGQAGQAMEQLDAPADVFAVRRWLDGKAAAEIKSGSGRRLRARTDASRGRYIRCREGPLRCAADIALDATLRAAAIRGAGRAKPEDGPMLVVTERDIRVKVREGRRGSAILFVVDASASMGANRRMAAVKGAILSLLNEAYQKRDHVGLIVFRGKSAELTLGFTRSVTLAHKQLASLPTGGRTPLAKGLELARSVIGAARIKDKELLPVIVLLSDGHATYPGGSAFKEALSAARALAAERIRSLVVDTEEGPARLGLAQKIAQSMDATLLTIEELRAETLVGAARTAVYFPGKRGMFV